MASALARRLDQRDAEARERHRRLWVTWGVCFLLCGALQAVTHALPGAWQGWGKALTFILCWGWLATREAPFQRRASRS